MIEQKNQPAFEIAEEQLEQVAGGAASTAGQQTGEAPPTSDAWSWGVSNS